MGLPKNTNNYMDQKTMMGLQWITSNFHILYIIYISHIWYNKWYKSYIIHHMYHIYIPHEDDTLIFKKHVYISSEFFHQQWPSS